MLKNILKLSFVFLCWPLGALAGSLFFSPERVAIPPGEKFEISLWLEPAGQSLNALGGELHFSPDRLNLVEIKNGDSIINFWPEAPHLVAPGVINFAGVIPGGFSGLLNPAYTKRQPGKLFSLVFSSSGAGDAVLTWSGIGAFLNQKDAHETSLATSTLSIHSAPGLINSAPVVSVQDDLNPPEAFTPVVSRDPNLFANQWFVAFATRDTESGLAHYELAEHRQPLPESGDWHVATSPAVLNDQTRGSFISVRALDRAGNERVITLPPARPIGHYPFIGFWVIIILCLVVFFYFYYSRRRRS